MVVHNSDVSIVKPKTHFKYVLRSTPTVHSSLLILQTCYYWLSNIHIEQWSTLVGKPKTVIKRVPCLYFFELVSYLIWHFRFRFGILDIFLYLPIPIYKKIKRSRQNIFCLYNLSPVIPVFISFFCNILSRIILSIVGVHLFIFFLCVSGAFETMWFTLHFKSTFLNITLLSFCDIIVSYHYSIVS